MAENSEVLQKAVESSTESEKGTLLITKTLNAPKELVYRAWTQPEHLINWWGPKNFKIGVARFELQPGGMFHYSMQTGDGPKMWGKFVYSKISAPDQLVYVNSFSDEEGNTTRAPFSETWPLEMLNYLTFTEGNNQTTLTLKSYPVNASQEEEETFASNLDNMQKGFGGTFEQLASYLDQLQS